MTKTCIITGINGQLSQYLAKHLLENEPDVRVIGTVRHKSFDNQPYIFDRSFIGIELMDLSDSHSIESLIVKHKPDYFINTAANAFVGESWQVPAQHFEINALAVLHQLEAIRKHSPHTHYFNMGTSEEFGISVKTGPQGEDTLLGPKSPYGASKCAARHIVSVWQQSYNLYAVQGWTFNFESPIRGEKYVTRKITKGVARIARAIKDGKPFEPLLLGNLDSSRSWQHAADVADGVWKMLNQKEPKPYVLSASDTHLVRDFVNMAFAEARIIELQTAQGPQGNQQVQTCWRGEGLDEVFELGGMETHVSESGWDSSVGYWKTLVKVSLEFFRPSDVTYLHGDAHRARTELGWTPRYDLKTLVREMVQNDLKEVGL